MPRTATRAHRGSVPFGVVLTVLLWRVRASSAARVAVCVTGQLPRLELGTKIANFVSVNLASGHDVGLFMRLSNETSSSFGTAALQSSYTSFTAQKLEHFIVHQLNKAAENTGQSTVSVVYDTFTHPRYFQPYNNTIPTKNLTASTNGARRFQMNFIMLSQIRACARTVFAHEVATRSFFDFLIRVREDSYVWDAWMLQPEVYAGGVSDVKPGGWGGLNDHTYVVDRGFADVMLRGPVEDYYLNNTETGNFFGTTEDLLSRVTQSMRIPVHILDMCQLPLVTIRGLAGTDQWKLDMLHARLYAEEILRTGVQCNTDLLLNHTTVPVHPIDLAAQAFDDS